MSVPMRWQDPEITKETIQSPSISLRRQPARRMNSLRVVLGVGSACLIMSACTALGIQIGNANAMSQQNLRLVSVPGNHERIIMTNATIDRRLGFVTVTGSVFNATKHETLPNVEVVVELLDIHNHTLGVQPALITYNPLPAGQVSPFSVEMNDDPKAVGVRIRPRKMFGGPLDQ